MGGPAGTLKDGDDDISWFLLGHPDKLEVCFFGTEQKLARTSLPLFVTFAGWLVTVGQTKDSV